MLLGRRSVVGSCRSALKAYDLNLIEAAVLAKWLGAFFITLQQRPAADIKNRCIKLDDEFFFSLSFLRETEGLASERNNHEKEKEMGACAKSVERIRACPVATVSPVAVFFPPALFF